MGRGRRGKRSRLPQLRRQKARPTRVWAGLLDFRYGAMCRKPAATGAACTIAISRQFPRTSARSADDESGGKPRHIGAFRLWSLFSSGSIGSVVQYGPHSSDVKSQVELSESELEAAAMLLEKLFGIDAGAILSARLRSGASLQGRARIVELAGRVRRHRLRRRELFPQPIFGEPPWEMLLALYLDFPDGTTVATLSSRVGLPGTTVRRWLGYLKDHHLVKTARSGDDRRSLSVSLTGGAREKLDSYFNDIELI